MGLELPPLLLPMITPGGPILPLALVPVPLLPPRIPELLRIIRLRDRVDVIVLTLPLPVPLLLLGVEFALPEWLLLLLLKHQKRHSIPFYFKSNNFAIFAELFKLLFCFLSYLLLGSFFLRSSRSYKTVNATRHTRLSSVSRAMCDGPTTIRLMLVFNPVNAAGVTNPYLLIFSDTSFNLQKKVGKTKTLTFQPRKTFLTNELKWT